MYEGGLSPLVARARSYAVPAAFAVALLAHAHFFDFVCDDAFIALRQAQNLALHGAPVYNLGERVEAGTSPAWALILALGLLLRVPPVTLLSSVSLMSGVGLVFATWALTGRLLPDKTLARAFALAVLVTAAPIAAWSIGGLETPLFAALVTWSFVEIDRFASEPGAKAATRLGLVLAAMCLVRLEGLLLVAIAAPFLFKVGRPLLVRALAFPLGAVALLTIFRLAYYGLPLPHTFYAKTAGIAGSRTRHGLAYAAFCMSEIGFFLSTFLLVSPLFLKSRPVVWTARFFVPAYVAYVVQIGGDFLDLYRFFVPMMPLVFVTFTAAVSRLFDHLGAGGALRIAAGLFSLLPHGIKQASLGARVLATRDPERASMGIEPIGWTKRAAHDWGVAGAWLASVAQPGDTLATGAAGAMPYFSGLPNFDLLGLAAPEVAAKGTPLGIRPGHARYATVEQIKARNPTFLHIDDPIGRRAAWESAGYVGVVVRGDGITMPFFVQKDRAGALLKRPDVGLLPTKR